MNNVIKKVSDSSKKGINIVADIREVCIELNSAYARFNNETNEDLLESTIFEIEALKARYRYLLKMARESDVRSSDINVIWEAEPAL